MRYTCQGIFLYSISHTCITLLVGAKMLYKTTTLHVHGIHGHRWGYIPALTPLYSDQVPVKWAMVPHLQYTSADMTSHGTLKTNIAGCSIFSEAINVETWTRSHIITLNHCWRHMKTDEMGLLVVSQTSFLFLHKFCPEAHKQCTNNSDSF